MMPQQNIFAARTGPIATPQPTRPGIPPMNGMPPQQGPIATPMPAPGNPAPIGGLPPQGPIQMPGGIQPVGPEPAQPYLGGINQPPMQGPMPIQGGPQQPFNPYAARTMPQQGQTQNFLRQRLGMY